MNAHILSDHCTGPNRACRAAHKAGRSIHVIPTMRPDPRTAPALVMPTYHYTTAQDGIDAINQAFATAPMVATEDDLYRFRAERVAHFLPIGWIDPSRR